MDVYAEWVDACDAVAKGKDEEKGRAYSLSHNIVQDRGGGRNHGNDIDVDDEDQEGYTGDGIVPDDEDY